MIDLPRHSGQRNQLVAVLREKGIRNEAVLAAIAAVPRHLFLESGFEQFAYQDKAFPIAAGQTISQPYTVAYQTELLGVTAGAKVLEIGTGSGYQSAVLCQMGVKVFSVERQKELFDFSYQMLRDLGYTITQKYGDGYKGLPTFAPFDGIVVTAGAPFIPKDLMAQLKIGAKLVIPVGDVDQVMNVVTRISDKKFTKEETGAFKFVPMLKKKEK